MADFQANTESNANAHALRYNFVTLELVHLNAVKGNQPLVHVVSTSEIYFAVFKCKQIYPLHFGSIAFLRIE